MNVLIKTNGNLKLGNGHIIRSIQLYKKLTEFGHQSMIMIENENFWINFLKKNKINFVVEYSQNQVDEIIKYLNNNNNTHFIYDERNNLNEDDLASIRKITNCKIVVVDSPENLRLEADLNIYPPISQIYDWNWDNYNGKILSGWEYVFLRDRDNINYANKEKYQNKVLLSFGSTDPFGFTKTFIKLILDNYKLFNSKKFIIVMGPQNQDSKEISKLITQNNNIFEVKVFPHDLFDIMNYVDYAFISFGVTAYELARLNTPFISISISEDHENSASVFIKNNLAMSFGILDINKKIFIEIFNKFSKNLDHFMDNKINLNICDWNKIIKNINSL